MPGYGYRMDCQPYLGGALETKLLLEKLPLRKDKLANLAVGGLSGIYYGGRETIHWVSDPELGIPCLGSTDIVKADLHELPFISKEQVRQNPSLAVKSGWTLITRSGTIGRTAYVRSDMDGMACQDVLRIVPDKEKVAPGFLYAYLTSKFGVPLVVSGTYGAMIQHLEPEHIADLPVPRLDKAFEQRIDTDIESAAKLRVKASEELRDARNKLVSHFGQPPRIKPGTRHPNWSGHAISSKRLARVGRMDTLYFNPLACDLDDWLANHQAGSSELGSIAELFDVPPFKHIYVEPSHGVGFFTSADLFLLDKKPDKFLSRTQTKGLKKYILETGWVLIARSGQLNGNIGKAQFVDSAMVGTTTSDHVIRVIPHDKEFSAGYLYAYLSIPEFRFPMLQRTATGASIPALWPIYLSAVRVLRPPAKLNSQIDEQVREALEMRVRATKIEDECRGRVEHALEKEGAV